MGGRDVEVGEVVAAERAGGDVLGGGEGDAAKEFARAALGAGLDLVDLKWIKFQ